MADGLGSVVLDSEDARALLQRRVALLALVILVLSVLLQALARWVNYEMRRSAYSEAIAWTPNLHLLVLLCFGAIWWRARSGRRSVRELEILDILCPLVPLAFSSWAFWRAGYIVRPNLVHVLGTGDLLVLRAVLVPSSGRRTAIIGLVVMVSVTVWTELYFTYHVSRDVAPAGVFTAASAVWSLVAVIISTVASQTIFGLRLRVREATQLGQYTLLRKIGEGGMGVVYEARHAFLRRRTALKLLPVDKAGKRSAARFEREVQVTSTLTHPNTIAIYDYGRSPAGVFYYAMEYLHGIDLQRLVERGGPQPAWAAIHVLEQVSSALIEAHGAGLIHRDIKPANVILCERGGTPAVAKVVDFGLVKVAEDAGDASESSVGTMMGTPLYMSPEWIKNPDRVDARSDLYALGAVGYFLVTGRHVFAGATPVEVYAHHLHTQPVPPSEVLGAEVDPALEGLLLACLAKDPALRPASARALNARLGSLRERAGIAADRIATWWQQCRPLIDGAADTEPATLAGATTVLHVELEGRR